ncbi:Retrotrans gag domain-containing protein [Abeliophyllum distichum]|uniref:Retrotrans gag domain-containing protein n=1 Tax=Abeliophyllum distichum TaxID=126358 RepID=A0ABD1PR54_9LAMI
MWTTASGQAKDEERSGVEVKAPATSYSHPYSDPRDSRHYHSIDPLKKRECRPARSTSIFDRLGDGPTKSFEEDYDDDEDEDLLFFYEMRRTPVPRGFIKPKLDKYIGRGDPMYHLAYYKIEMKLKNASPSLKCMAFHMNLTGTAKRWYLKLKLGSIRSWPQLKKAFMSAFMGHTFGEALATRLNDIIQGVYESVKIYFNRFQNKSITVELILDEKSLDALWNRQRMETMCWRDVRNKNPQTYNKLVDLIKEEIQTVERIENRKNHESKRGMMAK